MQTKMLKSSTGICQIISVWRKVEQEMGYLVRKGLTKLGVNAMVELAVTRHVKLEEDALHKST